jgi:hypothetical protein
MIRVRLLFLLGLLLLFVGWYARYATEDPLNAAERAFRQGDYAQAATLYAYATRVTDDPGHALFNRAASLYCQSQFEAAAEGYRSARHAENPQRTARANYDLGNCALRGACLTKHGPVAALLQQAIAHYQACIDQEGNPEMAPPELVAHARHNQDLARKLLESVAYRAQKAAKAKEAAGEPNPQPNQGENDRAGQQEPGGERQPSLTASAEKKGKPSPKEEKCLH